MELAKMAPGEWPVCTWRSESLEDGVVDGLDRGFDVCEDSAVDDDSISIPYRKVLGRAGRVSFRRGTFRVGLHVVPCPENILGQTDRSFCRFFID
jgi:hypothetical protein